MGKISSISRVAIGKLKPYENNAKKHSAKQIDKIAESIKEFGFISPLLIDKDFNVIAGHGRLKAAEKLNMADVPCAFVEGLTDAQRRAYILADNRLAEFGEWDKELVRLELDDLALQDLAFDVGSFEFPELEPVEDDLLGYYGDERERTNKAYHLEMVDYNNMTDDFWQMPIVWNDNHIPKDLIGFNYAKTSKNKNAGIHFYIDDYQFERVWNYPEKYAEILSQYDCVLTPDFSLYMDMPTPMKIWNVYRSRQIGAFYQSLGLRVIPTVSWAEDESFEYCFRGIPKGSIVSVSTVGVKRDPNALKIWSAGMDEMIHQIEPSDIVLYGGALDYDYKGINVHEFSNKVLDNWTDKGE